MTKTPHYEPGDHALWADLVCMTTPYGQLTREFNSCVSPRWYIRAAELKIIADFFNAVSFNGFLDRVQARFNKQAMLTFTPAADRDNG